MNWATLPPSVRHLWKDEADLADTARALAARDRARTAAGHDQHRVKSRQESRA